MNTTHHSPTATALPRLRLDKWLWAARFYKTRAIAVDAIEKHRVHVNGAASKPAREIKVGDVLRITTAGPITRCVVVQGLSAVRGPAPQAALLYSETPESIAERQAQAEQRRLAPEPAHSQNEGRPTKRDRRQLNEWDQRWSASAGDE